MSAVELADVSFSHRRGGGVSGITFSAEEGEYVALFGGWAGGKTTLLQLLAGRIAPESGTVHVRGRSPRAASASVGYATQRQDAPITSPFTPYQVLTHRLIRRATPAAQRAARIAEMLDLFDLFDARDRPVRELSHGQRVGLRIAAALVHRPSVLLLDNLTAALPRPIADRLSRTLTARRADGGLTVIHATTRAGEAELADRVLLLDSGRALAYDSPAGLLADQAADVITVEAIDPGAVQRTLRGIFDVEILETHDGLQFAAADGTAIAAHLLRHPAGDVRAVNVRPPTLWDVVERLRST